jgi:hypothetical protein
MTQARPASPTITLIGANGEFGKNRTLSAKTQPKAILNAP